LIIKTVGASKLSREYKMPRLYYPSTSIFFKYNYLPTAEFIVYFIMIRKRKYHDKQNTVYNIAKHNSLDDCVFNLVSIPESRSFFKLIKMLTALWTITGPLFCILLQLGKLVLLLTCNFTFAGSANNIFIELSIHSRMSLT
jgi:hypothetical protein